MIERKPCTLVIGCGEKGASWIAKNYNPGRIIIGLDVKQPKEINQPFITGDVFNLPIKNESVSQIHADFIVNGLIDRKIAAAQILSNPDILDTNYFPPLVRQWFTVSINRSHEFVRKNIKKVGILLRTVAMREMWRVLADNGSLEILDFDYNIEWITRSAPQILEEHPMSLKLEPLRVTQEDFERSDSLEKVIKGKVSVQKIKLTKLRIPSRTSSS